MISKKIKPPFQDPKVAAVFQGYPEDVKEKMLALRTLVFQVAAASKKVGQIEETLKWGEPAYMTPQTKSGSTIRMDWKDKRQQYGLFFNCHTQLVESFRSVFGEELNFDGNRAIFFERDADFPGEKIRYCLSRALTYHLDKKK